MLRCQENYESVPSTEPPKAEREVAPALDLAAVVVAGAAGDGSSRFGRNRGRTGRFHEKGNASCRFDKTCGRRSEIAAQRRAARPMFQDDSRKGTQRLIGFS